MKINKSVLYLMFTFLCLAVPCGYAQQDGGGNNISKQCENSIISYARYRDSGDLKGYMSLFTDDAVFTFRGKKYRGKKAIEDMVAPTMKEGSIIHVVSNINITGIDGNSATGHSYALIFKSDVNEPGVASISGPTVLAEYIDEFRLTGNSCKIYTREFWPKFVFE